MTIPVNSIWDPRNPNNYLSVPVTTQPQLQQTLMIPSMVPQGSGSIWSGDRMLNYNNGKVTRNYNNTPVIPVRNTGTTVNTTEGSDGWKYPVFINTPVSTPSPRSPVASAPSYTYAYQNTPAPTVTPEQKLVSGYTNAEPSGWDFYRKNVLRG